MKKEIQNCIEEGKILKAWNKIQEYEKMYPYDSEIFTFKYVISMLLEDREAALLFAGEAVRLMPYVADVQYNFAMANEINGNYVEALEHYGMAKMLTHNGMDFNFDINELDSITERVFQHLNEVCEDQGDRRKVEYAIAKQKLEWEVELPVFHSSYSLLESEYYDYWNRNALFAAYARTTTNSFIKSMGGELNKSCYHTRTELQRIRFVASSITIDMEKDSYLSILTFAPSVLSIDCEGEKVQIEHNEAFQFVNYRIPKGKCIISSADTFLVGNVIETGHHPQNKKVVLNIFVDGLSQTILDNDFETLMPNTYRFFRKGVICKNAYSTSDWTLPSICSVTTGRSMVNHQMIHSKLLRKVDEATPMLFEYFQEAGYNTTKIGGNWRIAPNYGYARGMDRVLYQMQYNGFSIDSIISGVQDQLYEMRDTDQFIWMEIGELHQIADDVNLSHCRSERPIFDNVITGTAINSVKQEYDHLKIEYYKDQIAMVDRKLETLYHYLEQNYQENEIIVSLFADHGQGFLVRPEEEFLGDSRSKVAFMFRGNGVEGMADEHISICDYSAIMCKLAGIPYQYEFTDANLPTIFGGEQARDYTLTETIHVGDPYQVGLKNKFYQFYLHGKENVNAECRVPLEEYEVSLYDKNGNRLEDSELIKKYTEICLKHIAPCVIYK